jgi:GT2 family glycosyltransferase
MNVDESEAPAGLIEALEAARCEADRQRVAVEQAIADRDLAINQLDLVYRSTSWRLTAPVRSLKLIKRSLVPAQSASPFLKFKRGLKLTRFALKQWRLFDLLRRTIAIVRLGGWRALRHKLTQTERMAQFVAAGEAARAPQAANSAYQPKPAQPRPVALPPQGPRELSASFSMPADVWDGYLEQRLLSRLGTAGTEVGTAATPASSPGCWLLVDAGRSDVDRLSATLRSATELGQRANFAVGVVVIAPSPSSAAATARGRSAASLQEAVSTIPEADLIVFVAAGDLVHPEFAAVVKLFGLFGRRLALLDLYIRTGDAVFPLLLPGANLCHALNCNYFRSRFVARADAVRDALARPGGDRPYDIAGRIMGAIYAQEQWDDVAHVDLPMIEIAESIDDLAAERNRSIAEGREAVFPSENGEPISVADFDPRSLGKVSAIICTRDKGILLRQIVSSLLNNQQHLLAEVIVVSNCTANQHALRNLAELRARDGITVLQYDAPFNFSAQSNLGAKRATGDYLLFLNDDIVPTSEDWLAQLLLPFANPRVGITSPLLLYPDERVQHAGMYLGYKNVAGHTLRHALLPDQDYMFLATAPRFVSVATGAALLMPRPLFENLNGFDTTFATYIQDVDLCMRVGDLGYDLVFNPHSVLIHMESPSVKALVHDDLFHQTRIREFEIFSRRWADQRYVDPFHNSNFSKEDETLHRLN